MHLQSLNQIPLGDKAILIHVAGAPLLHRDLGYSLFSAVMHLFMFYIWHDLSSSNHFSRRHSLWYFMARSLKPCESKAASGHPALWRFVVILSKVDKYISLMTYTFLTCHNSFFTSQRERKPAGQHLLYLLFFLTWVSPNAQVTPEPNLILFDRCTFCPQHLPELADVKKLRLI